MSHSNPVAHESAFSSDTPEQYRERINKTFAPNIAVLQEAAAATLMLRGKSGGSTYLLVKSNLDTEKLWELYLAAAPNDQIRQENNCNCCRAFFKKWGGIATLDHTGRVSPLLFTHSCLPEFHNRFSDEFKAFFAEDEAVRAAFTENFNDSPLKALRPVFADRGGELNLGMAKNGGFLHFNLSLDNVATGRMEINTPAQNAADSVEDARLFLLAINQTSDVLLKRASALLSNDHRTAKSHFPTVLKRVLELRSQYHEARRQAGGDIISRNLIMFAAMTEPKGILRFKQGLVGQFLEDLQNGTEERALAEFCKRASGELYMRPTAAPTRGAVAQAEKIFAELNLAPALRRRSLRRDELPFTLWTPKAEEKKEEAGGVFGHIKARNEGPSNPINNDGVINGGQVSYLKIIGLLRDGLVERLQYRVDNFASKSYSSLVTAVEPDSTPILSWDDAEKRSQTSYYTYTTATYPSAWGLRAGKEVDVIAVVPQVNTLHTFIHHGADAISEDWARAHLVLAEGADTNDCSLPLFPQNMRPELHQVRQVIEAYAKTAKLENVDQGLVCLTAPVLHTFIVTDKNGVRTQYQVATLE